MTRPLSTRPLSTRLPSAVPPGSDQPSGDEKREALHQARWEMLEHLQALLDGPIIVLSLIWLALIILSFTEKLSHSLSILSSSIWGIFVLDFLLEFLTAPHKGQYLKKNWLTIIALLLPALGMLRVLRVVRLILTAHAAGYLGLLRLVTTLNWSLRAVRNALGHRGIGYAIVLAGLVLVLGAAGMLACETPDALRQAGVSGTQSGGLHTYGDAIWFTSMLMTTIGSNYSPFTPLGRILCWIISVFSISVLGYITASIASYFVGQDQQKKPDASTGRKTAAKPRRPRSSSTENPNNKP